MCHFACQYKTISIIQHYKKNNNDSKRLLKFIAQLFPLLEDDKNGIIDSWDNKGKLVIIHNEFLF